MPWTNNIRRTIVLSKHMIFFPIMFPIQHNNKRWDYCLCAVLLYNNDKTFGKDDTANGIDCDGSSNDNNKKHKVMNYLIILIQQIKSRDNRTVYSKYSVVVVVVVLRLLLLLLLVVVCLYNMYLHWFWCQCICVILTCHTVPFWQSVSPPQRWPLFPL